MPIKTILLLFLPFLSFSRAVVSQEYTQDPNFLDAVEVELNRLTGGIDDNGTPETSDDFSTEDYIQLYGRGDAPIDDRAAVWIVWKASKPFYGKADPHPGQVHLCPDQVEVACIPPADGHPGYQPAPGALVKVYALVIYHELHHYPTMDPVAGRVPPVPKPPYPVSGGSPDEDCAHLQLHITLINKACEIVTALIAAHDAGATGLCDEIIVLCAFVRNTRQVAKDWTDKAHAKGNCEDIQVGAECSDCFLFNLGAGCDIHPTSSVEGQENPINNSYPSPYQPAE